MNIRIGPHAHVEKLKVPLFNNEKECEDIRIRKQYLVTKISTTKLNFNFIGGSKSTFIGMHVVLVPNTCNGMNVFDYFQQQKMVHQQ
jgi:hypothetical protein